jgi:hypothetical protein
MDSSKRTQRLRCYCVYVFGRRSGLLFAALGSHAPARLLLTSPDIALEVDALRSAAHLDCDGNSGPARLHLCLPAGYQCQLTPF